MSVPAVLENLDMRVAGYITLYGFSSSTLLVLNKYTLSLIPSPNLVLCVQLLFTAVICKVLSFLGKADVDKLEWPKVKAFLPAVPCFFVVVLLNLKALQSANVEAVIVFRCSSPLFVAVLEYFFMDRELPSPRSWFSLSLILVGATAYALLDKGISVVAYGWLIAYLAVVVFDMLFIKHITDSLPMTTWGRVYYNNILSVPPTMAFFLAFGEYSGLEKVEWSGFTLFILFMSCVDAVLISLSGWGMRKAVSALSYTVVGVVNKLLTILINVFIWDNHAPPAAIAALVVCITGSTFYRQPPLRTKPAERKEEMEHLTNGDMESGESKSQS